MAENRRGEFERENQTSDDNNGKIMDGNESCGLAEEENSHSRTKRAVVDSDYNRTMNRNCNGEKALVLE